MEIDHIDPRGDGGGDEIENALPVCFECHAEIHCYDNKHPRGRKYRSEELRAHREQWLAICRDRPELFVAAVPMAEVGPLCALVDELQFNMAVAEALANGRRGALFSELQFQRAVAAGAISVLDPDLKKTMIDAYVAITRAIQRTLAEIHQTSQSAIVPSVANASTDSAKDASPRIEKAHRQLLAFLNADSENS